MKKPFQKADCPGSFLPAPAHTADLHLHPPCLTAPLQQRQQVRECGERLRLGVQGQAPSSALLPSPGCPPCLQGGMRTLNRVGVHTQNAESKADTQLPGRRLPLLRAAGRGRGGCGRTSWLQKNNQGGRLQSSSPLAAGPVLSPHSSALHSQPRPQVSPMATPPGEARVQSAALLAGVAASWKSGLKLKPAQ